jgi:uncharacterized membrane protein YheB (UPF0754 family)
MKTVLLWLIPPAIGAVIGYVTNAIAIKMLFRPLKEVYIWKWRLPFTPGILPRQRRQLAQNIGRMVERELLTPEIVRARLAQEDIRASIKNRVANFTNKLLSTRIAEFSLAKTSPVAGDVLKSFFQSPIVASILDKAFNFIIENIEKNEFFAKSIHEILGDERVIAMEKGVSEAVSAYVTANSNVISEQVTVVFANNFSQIADECIVFLKRNDVHGELETHGRVFLNNAIGKLSATQRFFLSIGQYDERLSERMPEIIDDFIRQLYTLLSDNVNKRRLIMFFADNTERLLSNSGPQIVDVVAGFLSTQNTKPLKELLQNIKKEDIQVFWQKILDFMPNALRNSSVIADFLKELFEKHGDIVVASFFPITVDQKDALDVFITEKLLLLADKQIGNALDSINVTALVADRIDELDMIQVERIILDIMADQLKWINVFGALLGALIGFSQSLSTWLIG